MLLGVKKTPSDFVCFDVQVLGNTVDSGTAGSTGLSCTVCFYADDTIQCHKCIYSYDFLNTVSLARFIVRIEYVIHIT